MVERMRRRAESILLSLSLIRSGAGTAIGDRR